ncbi:MAG TPA: hypothetical protein VMV81_04825 [Phycisphaerae bacterium]|nr:hypothetical protein [Phycisphaerae bacterium]
MPSAIISPELDQWPAHAFRRSSSAGRGGPDELIPDDDFAGAALAVDEFAGAALPVEQFIFLLPSLHPVASANAQAHDSSL